MVAEADGARDAGKGDCGDDARASLGQRTLIQLGVRGEQTHGDRLAEHGVAEELEALVVRHLAVFIRPGAVRQGKSEKLGVDDGAELVAEVDTFRGNVTHGKRLTQTSATLRPLYSRNSSVPCESVTTFAWCGRL
jgi:hypothetical protein